MNTNSNKSFGWAVALMSVTAFALCIVMVVHSLAGAHLLGCSAGSSCDAVLGSKWSLLFGILPVSALAAGVYLALAICGVAMMKDDDDITDLMNLVMPFLAGAIIAASLWFIVLMAWKVRALCPYCLTTHAIGLVMSLLILVHFAREGAHGGRLWGSCAAGAACGLALAAVQLLTVPDSRYESGQAGAPLPVPVTNEVPVIGNPDAEHVFELLYDYRCPHCRTVHGWLKEIVEDDPSLAFVLCPTPLSKVCNPYIPADSEDNFKGSCELTRLALALWTISPDIFYQFDSWLFDSPGSSRWAPREPEEAHTYALSLASDLDIALSNPWIEEYLSLTLELFGRTTTEGHSGIPRFICDDKWLIPDVQGKQSLYSLLKESFAI